MITSEDNRTIKASFRECAISDRRKFAQSNCIVPISVGQPIHEGKKLFAALTLINNSFKSCTLLVDDSIQRHTMAIGSSEDEAFLYKRSIEAGNEWLERNKGIYNQFSIPCKIMRWDDWSKSEGFGDSYETVEQEYFSNKDYQIEVNLNISEFLMRYYERYQNASVIGYEKAFFHCRRYLIEECAVMCLWAKAGYDFEVYPAGRNRAMTATYNHIIQPNYQDALKSVALRFKKYPAPSTSIQTESKESLEVV